MKIIRMIILVSIVLMLLGCNISDERQVKEAAFANLYSGIDMNKNLKLSVIEGANNYKIGRLVKLFLVNKSSDNFQFPKDFNAAIWTYNTEKKEWISITNNVEYQPDKPRILSSNPEAVEMVFVEPSGVGNTEVTIRIVVLGNKTKNGDLLPELEGAYIDVSLQP